MVMCNGIHIPWSVKKLSIVVLVGFGSVAFINHRLPFINPKHMPFYFTCLDPTAPFSRMKFDEADVIFTIGAIAVTLFHSLALLASLILALWLAKKGMEVRGTVTTRTRVSESDIK